MRIAGWIAACAITVALVVMMCSYPGSLASP
jgi:hypothetical protein